VKLPEACASAIGLMIAFVKDCCPVLGKNGVGGVEGRKVSGVMVEPEE
jgi:hypothetical protein